MKLQEKTKMTFKELKKQIKEQQKQLASEIKAQKGKRKSSPDGYVSGLPYNRDGYRHKHIAYCQFFNGTPYEKIELTCHEKPRKSSIKKYMTEWEAAIDKEEVIDEEAVRLCA
jgi:Zn-dependent metalloprotease